MGSKTPGGARPACSGSGVPWRDPASAGGIGASAIVVSVLALGAAAGIAYAASRVSSPGDVFSSSSDRPHLQPIRVSTAVVCPHVSAMHAGADTVQASYADQLLFGRDTFTWPARRAQLDQELVRFDAAIAAGIPSFPKRIQRELVIVRRDIAEGRRRMALDQNSEELDRDTFGLLEHGSTHFGNASALLGHQCGALLATSRSNLIPQVLTPPST